MNNLKSLLPSLVLMAIYFLADALFSTQAGIICAVILGSGEFIYTRLKERRYDKLILFNTLFFCLLGGITLYTEGGRLERFQPGFIEAALCILLGIFAWSKADLSTALPASYRKTIHLTAGQQQQMRNTVKILFFILCGHTLLIFATAPYGTDRFYDFISSTLLYLIIVLFFCVLFIRNKLIIRKMKKEEWLPIVNEKGDITGQSTRTICHSGSKLLHPVVHLHIVNPQNEVFLQKRSLKKDLLPGMWDTAVGGHVGLNERIEEALKRETFEELGISRFDAQFIRSYVWESPVEKELVFSFLCSEHDAIRIDNDEVDEGRFWPTDEIEKNLENAVFTPNFKHEYQTLLRELLATK